jgi:hypothetical protein
MNKFTNEVSAKKQQYGDLIVTVCDKYGTELQRVEQVVDSFNEQIWKCLQRTFSGIASLTIRDLANNSDITPTPINRFYDSVINGYGGIVVGSGTAQTAINTNIMGTLIQHGSGSGQLQAMPSTNEFDQSTSIATITRPFVNVSSDQATITVNEVGIAAASAENSTTTNAWLFVRDVLLSSINVPFEATLVVQYKVRMFQGNNNYKNVIIRPFGLSYTTETDISRWGLVNTTGSLVSTFASVGVFNVQSDIGQVTRGLVLGTSNTASNATQIDLVSKINNGTGAGQLFYHQTTNGAYTLNTNSNSLFFQFYRSVENRSGSNIDVKEIGIFTAPISGSSFMLDRRVIDPPVTITNGNIISFTWEFCYEV